MEKSSDSSLLKAVPSKETTYSCTEEESGWTAYFEDFSNNNNNRREEEGGGGRGGAQSFGCTSSLVSDAASGAAWKLVSHNNQNHAGSIGVPPNNISKKLSFKKTRTKKISGDDLEDTASSPVNSPKGKEETTVGHFAEMEQADDEKTSDCTDLKKKGLCSMSLLVNYLG
ncbi:unnamed protein product [Malus baccata var. baccata]